MFGPELGSGRRVGDNALHLDVAFGLILRSEREIQRESLLIPKILASQLDQVLGGWGWGRALEMSVHLF